MFYLCAWATFAAHLRRKPYSGIKSKPLVLRTRFISIPRVRMTITLANLRMKGLRRRQSDEVMIQTDCVPGVYMKRISRFSITYWQWIGGILRYCNKNVHLNTVTSLVYSCGTARALKV